MSTFLLEIGTEELPADFVQLVIPQLKELVSSDLKTHRINYDEIKCSTTPRRIVLFIEGVATSTEDYWNEYKGPSAAYAFKDGIPTKSAIGFAKRYGIECEDLQIRNTKKGDFVFARILEKGIQTTSLFSEFVPNWIESIQGRRFMRWSSGQIKFARPVRSLLCMIDEQIIPIRINSSDPEIISSNISFGHRLFEESIEIDHTNTYLSRLLDAGVYIERDKRLNLIRELVQKQANNFSAVPDLPESLLNELTDLVEYPSVVVGEFDSRFLELPPEVLSTVMRVHQRYIPLFKKNAKKDPLALHSKDIMLNNFLVISNGLPSSSKTVQLGNERVLKARFSDAEFFLTNDCSSTSSNRCEQLKNVVFADGLGNLSERVNRINWIVNALLPQFRLEEIEINNLKRATLFCKHDLVSNMVCEFPELQGIIGAKYLLKEGEPREVSLSVLEHYCPRGAGDNLPTSESGQILAIAERLELLLSIFSKGQRPSGSSDPYALRRAGNGILQILWAKSIKLNLTEFLQIGTQFWGNQFQELNINHKALVDDLSEFFKQRIFSLLEESGIDIDLVNAVCGESICTDELLADPTDANIRAQMLQEMRGTGELESVQAVVMRASKLLQKADVSSNKLSISEQIDTNLFEKQSEHEMLKVLMQLEPIVNLDSINRYKLLASGLASGSDALSAFFDGSDSVMVMTDNIEVRSNRLKLLAILRSQSSVLADFNQISG